MSESSAEENLETTSEAGAVDDAGAHAGELIDSYIGEHTGDSPDQSLDLDFADAQAGDDVQNAEIPLDDPAGDVRSDAGAAPADADVRATPAAPAAPAAPRARPRRASAPAAPGAAAAQATRQPEPDDEPAAETTVIEEPIQAEPAYDGPAYDGAAYDGAAYDEPGDAEPAAEAPGGYAEASYDEAAYDEPAAEPAVEEPAYAEAAVGATAEPPASAPAASDAQPSFKDLPDPSEIAAIEAERKRRLDPANRPPNAEVDNTHRHFNPQTGKFDD